MLIIAHRGASARFPENTMEAFCAAVRMGVEWLELDVRLSRDRQLLVCHNAAIAGRALSEMTAEVVQAEARKQGVAVPRLREVMQAVRGQARLIVECKDPKSERPLVDLLVAENFGAHCVLISFHFALVRNLKRLFPAVRTGILLSRKLSRPLGALRETQADYLLPRYPLVNRKLVENIHEAGYRIVTWTVNREREMSRLIRLGVDGIITDHPDRLQQAWDSFRSQG